MNLEKLSLQFALHETGQDADILEAYERLIHDAMMGDHTCSTRPRASSGCGSCRRPLLENPPPVQPYARGSWGPASIQELIEPRKWRLPFERSWRRADWPAEAAEAARPVGPVRRGRRESIEHAGHLVERGTGGFDHVHVAGPGQRHEGGVIAQGHRLLDVVGAERRRHARIGRAVHQVLRNTEGQLGRGRTQRVPLGDIVGAAPHERVHRAAAHPEPRRRRQIDHAGQGDGGAHGDRPGGTEGGARRSRPQRQLPSGRVPAGDDAVVIDAVDTGQRVHGRRDVGKGLGPTATTEGADPPILDVVGHPSVSDHGSGQGVHQSLGIDLPPEAAVDQHDDGSVAVLFGGRQISATCACAGP